MASLKPGDFTDEYFPFASCPICLDVFRSPKLLPCFHTFCEDCLQRNASWHSGSTFPCPCCRKETKVPVGGVPDFQTNFYISGRDMDRSMTDSQSPRYSVFEVECRKFDGKSPDIQSEGSQALVDIQCKQSQDPADTNMLIRSANLEQQHDDANGLGASHVSAFSNPGDDNKERVQALKEKVREIEKSIRDRHALLVAAADLARDEAVTELITLSRNLRKDLIDGISKRDASLKAANDKHLLSDKYPSMVSGLNPDYPEKADFKQKNDNRSQNLKMHLFNDLTTPVLHFRATANSVAKRMRDFIGSPVKTVLSRAPCEVTIVENFRCTAGLNTDIYHLCPLESGDFCISFEPSLLHHPTSIRKYDKKGNILSELRVASGRVTMKAGEGNNSYYPTPPVPGWESTYVKSRSCLVLNNSMTGIATVYSAKVSADKQQVATTVFTICCGPHRAVDSDVSEQLLAVVEEGVTPDDVRHVRLYRRPRENAVDTYRSPLTSWQPSDVCFYVLGGHEVLLVSDELNDAIHVVKVKDDRLVFAHYLAPGYPLLVQPKAMNTDFRGRLWVGCRGGTVLVVEIKDSLKEENVH